MNDPSATLRKAWKVLRGTRDVLEQILDDDDDLILASSVISDEGETMNTEDQQTIETPVEKLRRQTFEAISRLSYNRSAGQTQEFFDAIDWDDLPMNRNKKIREFFGNPHLAYPESPTDPLLQQESVQARVAAIKEIIALVTTLRYNIATMAQQDREKPMTVEEKERASLEETRVNTIREIVEITGLSISQVQFYVSRWVEMSDKRVMKREILDLVPADPPRWTEEMEFRAKLLADRGVSLEEARQGIVKKVLMSPKAAQPPPITPAPRSGSFLPEQWKASEVHYRVLHLRGERTRLFEAKRRREEKLELARRRLNRLEHVA